MTNRQAKKNLKATPKPPEKPGLHEAVQDEKRSRNDFNEEQMHTEPACGPVETDPVTPHDDQVKSGHIPGVLAS
jgi:hypothetical protein